MITKNNTRGATFIEVLIVAAIFALLLGFASINLLNVTNKTTINSNINTLLTDIKQQQVKSMVGDTEGRAESDSYGIYFTQDRYVLFHGINYSATDSANFVVIFDPNFQFTSVGFSFSQIVFTRGSGEIINFVSGNNTITLTNTTSNQQKTIQLNKYGTITGVN